jgi:hypothetical protein
MADGSRLLSSGEEASPFPDSDLGTPLPSIEETGLKEMMEAAKVVEAAAILADIGDETRLKETMDVPLSPFPSLPSYDTAFFPLLDPIAFDPHPEMATTDSGLFFTERDTTAVVDSIWMGEPEPDTSFFSWFRRP